MDKFFDKKVFNSWGPLDKLTNNLVASLTFLIIITFILCILIYVAVKRQKPNKAPSTGVLLVEGLITMGDNYSSNLAENKFDKANPYFISLFCFLFFGHLISLFGFAPMGSNLSVVFAATCVTWLVTLGLGFAYKKIRQLISLINPIEMAGNFSPLISLTFRLFGNIIGGIVLITLLHHALDSLWAKMIKASSTESPAVILNPIKMLITPFFNAYLDVFVGAIQAFVFMTLTISYWSQSVEKEVKEKVKKQTKKVKKELLNQQTNYEIKNNVQPQPQI